jgi:hypothetical protein
LKAGAATNIAHACVFRSDRCRLAPVEPVAGDGARAETEYWFGLAWIAVGDVKRGRRMITEAREILARSPNATQRKLADQPVP